MKDIFIFIMKSKSTCKAPFRQSWYDLKTEQNRYRSRPPVHMMPA